jgi:mannose-6-phosphate isomerase-like protein (cupin superfamily)
MEVKVVRKEEGRIFMEGDELCREYLKTGKLTFGTSTLLPGQRGTVDKGHPRSHEVFFVHRGRIVLHLPDRDQYMELSEQDIVVMPEGLPYILINVGEEVAVIT